MYERVRERKNPWPVVLLQRRPTRRTVQVKPPRLQVNAYTNILAVRSYTVSPAHVAAARLFGLMVNPVQSSSHRRVGAGFRPLRMSQRRYDGWLVAAE